jgi:hypothetical protein
LSQDSGEIQDLSGRPRAWRQQKQSANIRFARLQELTFLLE